MSIDNVWKNVHYTNHEALKINTLITNSLITPYTKERSIPNFNELKH